MSGKKHNLAFAAFCALAVPCASLAGETKEIPCPPGMDFGEYMLLSTEGGYLYRPNIGRGKFAFVNKQERVPLSELMKVRPIINDEIWVELEFATSESKAEIQAEIVDRPNETTLAIYPDDKRAVVNVAALAKDGPKPDVLASRARKEMLRAFSFLAGISGGGVPGRIMDVMSDFSRLDAATEAIPGELVIRNAEYLRRSGIEPHKRVSYRTACEEGWAHKPTNVWEKAIWDQVHEKPTKGLKIKYDPKKGK